MVLEFKKDKDGDYLVKDEVEVLGYICKSKKIFYMSVINGCIDEYELQQMIDKIKELKKLSNN